MNNKPKSVVSMTTGLQARYYGNPHCVCCGIIIDQIDIVISLDNGYPPHCTLCTHRVYNSKIEYNATFPMNFYGHWNKTSSDNCWIQG